MKKKLINNPEEVVEEMVEGIVMAAPDTVSYTHLRAPRD